MFISFISFHFNIIAHMFLYCGLYCFSKFQPSADGFSSPRLKAGASKPLFGEENKFLRIMTFTPKRSL